MWLVIVLSVLYSHFYFVVTHTHTHTHTQIFKSLEVINFLTAKVWSASIYAPIIYQGLIIIFTWKKDNYLYLS